jgi:hypothetical protein
MARGTATSTSDYDVLGICRAGEKTRIARKQNGRYWDVVVVPEKDLRKLGDEHLAWTDALVLWERRVEGRMLVQRLKKLRKAPYTAAPKYERDLLKVWVQKQLERCRLGGVQGNYRRAELQNALIEHYFVMRKKRFWGPKAGFAWLQENDPATYSLLEKSLANPLSLGALGAVAERVYGVNCEKSIGAPSGE